MEKIDKREWGRSQEWKKIRNRKRNWQNAGVYEVARVNELRIDRTNEYKVSDTLRSFRSFHLDQTVLGEASTRFQWKKRCWMIRRIFRWTSLSNDLIHFGRKGKIRVYVCVISRIENWCCVTFLSIVKNGGRKC